MNPLARLFPTYTTVDEGHAKRLTNPAWTGHSIEVRPPKDPDSVPTTLTEFVQNIKELQTRWLGLRNASPTVSFEIRRPAPGKLRFQYSLPTKRLERKLRTQLANQIPGIEYTPGTDGLPVSPDETIGGGLLTTGRKDWYPLQTDFDNPPVNSLVAALHRDAMKDTKFVIQVLFQPVIGQPLRNRWWTYWAYKRIGYLRKEKEKLWNSRPPTPRERRQADAIEDKAGNPRFHTTIRFAIIGADEFTSSRLKELAGPFNIYEAPDSGQYLNLITTRSPRQQRIIDFNQAVADREFRGWHRRFQASTEELAALVSLPSRQQRNIQNAQP